MGKASHQPANLKLPKNRVPALRVVPMPADANHNGDIFGGWIMAQVDVAGGTVAGRLARGRVATVSVNSFVFKQPVQIGDVLSFYAEVVRVGNTSITVNVEVFAERHVAAALAVHRPRLGKARKPRAKLVRGRQLARMQFGIAAGQPATVAVLGWRLIGERGKGKYLRASRAPAGKQVRIDEGEGCVRRERDALAGRGEGGSVRVRGNR